jgi:hypothetical protein
VKPIKVPADVAVCPICKAALFAVEITGCSRADDGTWFPDAIGLDCETEPDFESDEYEGWYASHYGWPTVGSDWLPVHITVEGWMRNTFTVVESDDGWDLRQREVTK